MDLSKHISERVIYGVLDYLGDVGGFNDALGLIGYVIMMFFSFQPMNVFLIKRLFMFDSSLIETNPTRKEDNRLKFDLLNLIKCTILQHFPCKLTQRLYDDREMAYLKAVNKLNQELNIVNMIKDIRIAKAAMKHLLGRTQLKRLRERHHVKVIKPETSADNNSFLIDKSATELQLNEFKTIQEKNPEVQSNQTKRDQKVKSTLVKNP